MTHLRTGAFLATLALALSACQSDSDNISAATVPAPAATAPTTAATLTHVDESLLLTTAEATSWLKSKDDYGPAYVASAKWKSYLAFLEANMTQYGLKDIVRYTFPYDRWSTTEWPDKSGWTLSSDGTAVDVASYATFSGNTGPTGVTAPTILYDLNVPAAARPTAAQMKGKIIVFKQQLYASLPDSSSYALADYEYRTDDTTFTPLGKNVPASADTDYRNRQQLANATALGISVCQAAGAVGAVWVLDMSPLAAQGVRQHSTPVNYNCPGVMIDRNAGVKVVADAVAGKSATVVLNATVEKNSLPYQLVGFLPGKDYGTAKDQRIALATHTDGMSNVEDNGAMGIMAVLNYYSKIPQSQRPRTLMIFLDCRHFIAGAENAYPYDYFDDFPNAAEHLVGGVAFEHFGGKQFHEVSDTYEATGKPAHTYVYGFPNPLAVETATGVIKEVGLQRAINATPTPTGLAGLYATTGVNGQGQGFWFGAGFADPFIKNGHLPGWHVSGDWPSAGFQAYFPATNVRVDPEYFRTIVRTALRLVQTLSTADLTQLAPDWGIVLANIKGYADADFVDPTKATATRAALLAQFNTIYDLVRKSDYTTATAQLPALRTALQSSVTPAKAANALTAVDAVIALAKTGAKLPSA